jgi:hypothetical protein
MHSTKSPLLLLTAALLLSQLATAQPLQFSPNPTRITTRLPQTNNGPLEDTRQETRFYNENGHPVGTQTHFWQDGQWVRQQRTLAAPNADGQPAQITHYTWNGASWVENAREYFTYDANGHETLWTKEERNGSDWVLSNRRTQTYTTDGQLLTSLSELGNPVQPLSYGWEVTNQYNANNQRVDFRYRQFNNSTTDLETHSTFTYDTQGRLSGSEQEIKSGTNPWQWNQKRTLTYSDSDDRVDYVKVFAWNNQTNAWYWPEVSDEGYTYTPDSTVLVLNPLGAFQQFRQTTLFNAQGQRTSLINQNWSNAFQALRVTQREDWTYNADGSYNTYKFASRLVDASNSLVPQSENLYEYAPFVGTHNPLLQAQILVFPNPTPDWVFVQVTDAPSSQPLLATLCDATGKIVARNVLTTGVNSWSLAAQPAGIYTLQVTQGNASKTVQLVKN